MISMGAFYGGGSGASDVSLAPAAASQIDLSLLRTTPTTPTPARAPVAAVKAALPISASDISTPVLVAGGAVVLLGAVAILYKLRKHR